jgi:hypothetical protein
MELLVEVDDSLLIGEGIRLLFRGRLMKISESPGIAWMIGPKLLGLRALSSSSSTELLLCEMVSGLLPCSSSLGLLPSSELLLWKSAGLLPCVELPPSSELLLWTSVMAYAIYQSVRLNMPTYAHAHLTVPVD